LAEAFCHKNHNDFSSYSIIILLSRNKVYIEVKDYLNVVGLKAINSILVVCVDRDNDLGRKTGIPGPVIGRRAILNAAAKLAVADPSESDANSMFAAVKKFDEVKEETPNAEIEVAVLTGVDKRGYKSDRQIIEQLDSILEKLPVEGFVLVTDGAEDEQVLPLLQAKMRLISKEVVIVKQAKEVESTYYTIIEAFKDPSVSRLLLIPAVIFLAYYFLGSFSLNIASLVIGLYLLLKGLNLEEPIVSGARNFGASFSIQRMSFPAYILSVFVVLFGGITAYSLFSANSDTEPIINTVQSIQQSYFFLVVGTELFVLGKSIDSVHFKKAFELKKYFLSAVSILLIWLILDAGTQVFLKQADLNWFLAVGLFSFVTLFLAYQASKVFDVRGKITRLLTGLPVYDKQGKWIGKICSVDAEKENIAIESNKTKENIKVKKKDFFLREGRVMLVNQ
jgi:putative membrane protein